jgi:hypothetical protein
MGLAERLAAGVPAFAPSLDLLVQVRAPKKPNSEKTIQSDKTSCPGKQITRMSRACVCNPCQARLHSRGGPAEPKADRSAQWHMRHGLVFERRADWQTAGARRGSLAAPHPSVCPAAPQRWNTIWA